MNFARIALILALVSHVSCTCHVDDTQNFGGNCNYSIFCKNTIRGIQLQRDCLGSTNDDVNIEVTLRNASDNFHTSADLDFLFMVTTLSVSGNWPQTNLTFLDYMLRLTTVKIIESNIKAIINTPFVRLSRLEILNLSTNNLSDIEELFQFDSHPNKLRKLSLAHNFISVIPGDTFSELTNLVELDLSYNTITDLIEEPFNELTNLEKLFLNNNKIKDLNGAMNSLLKLKHLYIGYNEIKNIDSESMKVMYHLETLDVTQNQLLDIKPIIFLRHWYHFVVHSLCKIILSKNSLTHLPNTTSIDLFSQQTRTSIPQRLNVFTEIDLSKNSISHIEYNAFQSIPQLILLDVSFNKLFTFVVNADNLKFVKYLNLSTNYLHTLHYQSFAYMKYLQNLDLSHNEMDYFPDQSLGNNFMLKLIDMSHNHINGVERLRVFFNREGGILDLSNNSLSSLILPSDDAFGLTILILSSNKIYDPFLIKLNQQADLVKLDMSYNYIHELHKYSLRLPLKLEFLDLNHNLLTKIGPSSFANMNHLKALSLSHNFLTNIEYGAFHGLSSLLKLDLAYNRIQMLDSKLMMDLKHLNELSITHNDMHYLETTSWTSLKQDLRVFIDHNNFSCIWLAKVLSDFNNGFSKMRPTVVTEEFDGHSIEGVPCEQSGELLRSDKKFFADERLLVTNQKILKAVLEQTSYLQTFISRLIPNTQIEMKENFK